MQLHGIWKVLIIYLENGDTISRLRGSAFQLGLGCPDLCLREQVLIGQTPTAGCVAMHLIVKRLQGLDSESAESSQQVL